MIMLGIGGAPLIGQVAMNTGEKWLMLFVSVMLLLGSVIAIWQNKPDDWRHIRNWFE